MLSKSQLQLRRKYIGSSDIACIILDADGVPISPYGNPGSVYYSKTESAESETSPEMDLGNWLEEPLIQWAEKETGIIFGRNAFMVADNEICAATHDGINPEKGIGCEAKYVSQAKAHEWGENETEVPLYYYLQAQHQCGVSGLSRVFMPVAMAGFSIERRLYRVDRDGDVISAMFGQAVRFWKDHIIPRVPPSKWSVPPIEVLKARKREAGKQITLDGLGICGQAIFYHHCKKLVAKFEAESEQSKASLIDALGDAESAIITQAVGNVNVSYKPYMQDVFDGKQFRKDHPELAAKYTTKQERRRFTVKGFKNDDDGTGEGTGLSIGSEVLERPKRIEAIPSGFAIDNHSGEDGESGTDATPQESETT